MSLRNAILFSLGLHGSLLLIGMILPTTYPSFVSTAFQIEIKKMNSPQHPNDQKSIKVASVQNSAYPSGQESDHKIFHGPPPEYPTYSRIHREEGLVECQILISEKGIPTQILITKSSGFESLDQAVVQALQKWKFPNPQQKPTQVTQRFQFQLAKN